MDLRLLGLWTLVLCLSSVVKADTPQNCSPPTNFQNGFFIAQQDMSHNTDLYYGCDENFKTVEGTWWATVTCQNGTWSSEPQCIDASACVYPEIPNANYPKFPYKNNGEVLWLKCNPGYDDKSKHATTYCRDGNWTQFPECEKLQSSCEPPPELDNAVIVNQDYQDVYPDNSKAMYLCKSGFELETHSNMTVCDNGKWLEPYPSCKQKEDNPGRVPPVSTGASPIISVSDDNHQPLITPTDQCGSPPVVKNGVPYYESATSLRYGCISSYWYKLKGNRIVKCVNGHWTPAPTCEEDFCKLDTSGYSHLEHKDEFMKSGTQLRVNCPYKTVGSARAVCINSELYLSHCCSPPTHYFEKCGYDKITVTTSWMLFSVVEKRPFDLQRKYTQQ